jgi:integrase/recombinase XerD
MTTINIFFDKRTTNKDGKHPIKVLVYFAGRQKLFSSNLSATKEEYNSLWDQKNKKHSSIQLRKKMLEAKEKASAIVYKLGASFTFEKFKKIFYSDIDYVTKGSLLHLDVLYEQYITDLELNNQFKNAKGYHTSLTSLKKFGGNEIYLSMITVEYLKAYKAWLLNKGCTISTVRTYLRPLRAIWNKAYNDELIGGKSPFGKYGFSIGNSESARAALSVEERNNFWAYLPQNSAQQRAKDYWFFSLNCFGIAPIDIAKLTIDNVKCDKIEFSRSKTKNTDGEKKVVTAPLNQDMLDILNRQGNKKPQPYIFPILRAGMNQQEQEEAIEIWRKQINKVLRRIGTKLSFHVSLNLYSARHSFADILGEANYNEKSIADFLGNTSITMAKNYMGNARFEKAKQASSLMNYKAASLRKIS